jgi:hypothetical protein
VLLEVYKLYDVLGCSLTEIVAVKHVSSECAGYWGNWRAIPLRWVLKRALKVGGEVVYVHVGGELGG